jgi:hypothetical protein
MPDTAPARGLFANVDVGAPVRLQRAGAAGRLRRRQAADSSRVQLLGVIDDAWQLGKNQPLAA